MNSDQLRQFKVIAECGNLTKAAERLYITQPALSMALSKLEDEVARTLFIRDGRTLAITKDGKELLHYANIVVDAIDRATDYFKIDEYSRLIKLYRIGGTSIPLLTEGCYGMKDYRINCITTRNSDLPKIVGSGIADIVIADDRYMDMAYHKYIVCIPLYHQKLFLMVEKKSLLAQREAIRLEELKDLTLMGRSTPFGFNDWLNEIKQENRCDFAEEITIDNMTYFAERDQLPFPYLMGSFGIGTGKGKEYFIKRKALPVIGRYTERDIFLYYNSRNRKEMSDLIEKIKENAERINRLDKESGFFPEG